MALNLYPFMKEKKYSVVLNKEGGIGQFNIIKFLRMKGEGVEYKVDDLVMLFSYTKDIDILLFLYKEGYTIHPFRLSLLFHRDVYKEFTPLLIEIFSDIIKEHLYLFVEIKHLYEKYKGKRSVLTHIKIKEYLQSL